MEETKKKKFVKPELVKFDKPLNEVTQWFGSYYSCDHNYGSQTGELQVDLISTFVSKLF